MTNEQKIRFVIVDDEQSIRRLCMTVGQGLGFECAEAETAEAALESLEAAMPDIIVTDLKLPNLTGVELLRKIKEQLPRTEVAIMTGHGSIESAVEAMRQGAYDYIEKPFRVEKLRQLLQRMAEKVRLVNENQFLRERIADIAAQVTHLSMNEAGLPIATILKDATAGIRSAGHDRANGGDAAPTSLVDRIRKLQTAASSAS